MPTESKAAFAVRPATIADRVAVERLLTSNGLPIDGVQEAFDNFLVAEADEGVIGVVGMEYHGAFGLLRSTAVDATWRSRGIARQLVERIIAEAKSRDVRVLYLLTTTAEHYFPKLGFQMKTRDLVPAEIQSTTEFRSVCCSSAAVMSLSLDDDQARP